MPTNFERTKGQVDSNDPNVVSARAADGISGENSILKFPENIDSGDQYAVHFRMFREVRPDGDTPPTITGKGDIFLPMAGPISQTYSSSFDNIVSSQAIQAWKDGDTTGDKIMAVLKDLGRFGAAAADKLSFGQAGAAAGVVSNPRKQTIFSGINLREHSFAFNLVPINDRESDRIERIISKFKLAYAAEIDPNNDVLLKFPDLFNIHFVNAKTGSSVFPQVPDCFMQSLSVVYNDQSNKFFYDDKPTSVSLNMSFIEVKEVTKQDIIEGI